jgi:hypothetical protein
MWPDVLLCLMHVLSICMCLCARVYIHTYTYLFVCFLPSCASFAFYALIYACYVCRCVCIYLQISYCCVCVYVYVCMYMYETEYTYACYVCALVSACVCRFLTTVLLPCVTHCILPKYAQICTIIWYKMFVNVSKKRSCGAY